MFHALKRTSSIFIASEPIVSNGLIFKPDIRTEIDLNTWFEILNSNREDITSIANKSWQSVNINSQEPQIIAQFLSNCNLQKLNKNMSKIFTKGGFIVKFAGVFTHQTPIVARFNSSKENDTRCEIGDLLVIAIWMNNGKKVQYISSSLFQAKKGKSLSNTCQQSLYDNDLGFLYARPRIIYRETSFLKTPIRFWGFKDNNERGRGLKYLIIQKHPPTVISAPFSINSFNGAPFGQYIFNLLNMEDGIPIPLEISANEFRWYSIILDLVRTTSKKALPKRLAQRKNAFRGIGIEPLISFAEYFNSFKDYNRCSIPPSPPSKYFQPDFGDDEWGGIPILFIFIQQS